MNKICTSIEQSKKLIELGIDVNTADMFWDMAEPDKRRKPVVGPISDYYDMEGWAVPAWSLSVLLEILAKETRNIDEDGYVVLSSYKGNWWDISPINCNSEEIKESNSPLDAAFEMVCRLLENKKL